MSGLDFSTTVDLQANLMYQSRGSFIRARMEELVDSGDLKSPGACRRAGSSPAPGIFYFKYLKKQRTNKR